MITRPYRPDDRGACQSVFYHAVHGGTAEFYDADQRAAWAASPRFDPETPDRLAGQRTWLAEEDGTVIGFMSLREDGYLDMAYVLASAHGRGVADALYARMLEEARGLGAPTLTTDASHLARRFFTKHGWEVVYQEQHPARGQLFDRFRMRLTLKETAT